MPEQVAAIAGAMREGRAPGLGAVSETVVRRRQQSDALMAIGQAASQLATSAPAPALDPMVMLMMQGQQQRQRGARARSSRRDASTPTERVPVVQGQSVGCAL